MDAMDPGDYTVPELEAVLSDVEDQTVLETLLEKERAGKDRKTAIEAIEDSMATSTSQQSSSADSEEESTEANEPSATNPSEGAAVETNHDSSDRRTAESGESVQVLTFTLEDETYCVGIDHVTEIVEAGEVTAIPNAPSHVEGMMDLRGETTTIIDPRGPLGIERNGKHNGSTGRIVVFDPDGFDHGSATGWTVDEVHNVLRISTDDVDSGPADNESVHGIVKRDGEFLIWVSPQSLTS